MKLHFLRTTLFGGIFFLIPAVALIAIIGKALSLLHKLLDPIAARLPFESVIGLKTPMLLAIFILIALCFLAGVYSRTSLARKSVDLVEQSILLKIPGYALFKSLGESLLGIEGGGGGTVPVLVRWDEAWQIGIRVGEPAFGHVAVFFPDVPTPQSGSVLLVSEDRVIPANVPISSVMKFMKGYGAGATALLAGIPSSKDPAAPPA
jgi:uncharacterized membrane protein